MIRETTDVFKDAQTLLERTLKRAPTSMNYGTSLYKPEYLPTPSEIRRHCVRLRAAHLAKRRASRPFNKVSPAIREYNSRYVRGDVIFEVMG